MLDVPFILMRTFESSHIQVVSHQSPSIPQFSEGSACAVLFQPLDVTTQTKNQDLNPRREFVS